MSQPIPCQCGAGCAWAGLKAEEPCWGAVKVVGEEQFGDGDYAWIHACQGHEDVDDGKPYRAEAPKAGEAGL